MAEGKPPAIRFVTPAMIGAVLGFGIAFGTFLGWVGLVGSVLLLVALGFAIARMAENERKLQHVMGAGAVFGVVLAFVLASVLGNFDSSPDSVDSSAAEIAT